MKAEEIVKEVKKVYVVVSDDGMKIWAGGKIEEKIFAGWTEKIVNKEAEWKYNSERVPRMVMNNFSFFEKYGFEPRDPRADLHTMAADKKDYPIITIVTSSNDEIFK